uniref:Uncharacterized protein n=1 Tax=Oryza sativa subsp. japonica TaxID=39947 RepID=Q6K274_ORYSJ|nr:hypothetical protein [Oryza sativa Japonica Group]
MNLEQAHLKMVEPRELKVVWMVQVTKVRNLEMVRLRTLEKRMLRSKSLQVQEFGDRQPTAYRQCTTGPADGSSFSSSNRCTVVGTKAGG